MTDKLEDLFCNYKSEAFRLQTLTEYNVDEEKNAFQLFKNNGVLPDQDFYSDWNNNIKKQANNGKKFINTNLIPESGPTQYQKFIFPIVARQQEFGAQWLFMNQNDFLEIIKESNADIFDFWLFDNKFAFEIFYNKEGEWLKTKELEDKETIKRLVLLKDEFIKNSYDFYEYKKRWFQ